MFAAKGGVIKLYGNKIIFFAYAGLIYRWALITVPLIWALDDAILPKIAVRTYVGLQCFR